MAKVFPKEILVPSPLWKRIIAYIIDSFIIGIFIGMPLEKFFPKASSLKEAYWLTLKGAQFNARFAIAVFFMSLLVLAYWAVLEYWLGQSIGKAAMNIRVRTTEKGKLSLRNALLRNASKISSVLLALDCTYMLAKGERRRWLEKLSRTEVVESFRVQ